MNRENKQAIKVALVTGGARRVGASIVRYLHDAGFAVVIHCNHSLGDARTLASELNHIRKASAFVFQGNLLAEGILEKLVAFTLGCFGRLDVLVNNASVFIANELNSYSPVDWQHLFQIHVEVPYRLSMASQSFLAQHKGSIVNIADMHAEKPLQGYEVYCQSKAALVMQTKALAKALAPDIRVNAIAPGAVLWPEHENSLSESQKQKIIKNTPLKTYGKPEYIAQTVLFLAQNPFITGQNIAVDGGRGLA